MGLLILMNFQCVSIFLLFAVDLSVSLFITCHVTFVLLLAVNVSLPFSLLCASLITFLWIFTIFRIAAWQVQFFLEFIKITNFCWSVLIPWVIQFFLIPSDALLCEERYPKNHYIFHLYRILYALLAMWSDLVDRKIPIHYLLLIITF